MSTIQLHPLSSITVNATGPSRDYARNFGHLMVSGTIIAKNRQYFVVRQLSTTSVYSFRAKHRGNHHENWTLKIMLFDELSVILFWARFPNQHSCPTRH
jgi:hypothetical protein